MKLEDLAEKLIERGETKMDPSPIRDAFQIAVGIEPTESKKAHEISKNVRNAVNRAIAKNGGKEFAEIMRLSLLFDAPVNYDAYLRYLEFNRPMNEKFYVPRRKVLLPLSNALQDLVDDNLDELFLSEPPRVGKTSMLMFFVTWIIGRWPEKANLYSAYSDIITNAFYNGCLEVINDPNTYLWHDVFRDSKIVRTNAQEEIIDIDRMKRYPSLTCRSLYGTLNGACDCNGILISDDLIGGIEEALNKDRLDAAWSKVDNNLIPRAKEQAKVLWCGTRWSINDPAGRRMEVLLHDEKFKSRRHRIINLPALNEDDESNFNYSYGVGFSTEYYHQRRASFEHNDDMASWLAQYQGEPIEREGVLFSPGNMRFYNGILPNEQDLVRVFMAVDIAFGGGDFTSAPVCYQYMDGSVYVHDVVYDNGDKKVTQPLLVEAVKKNNVQAMQFEATKASTSYVEEVERLLAKDSLRINVTYRPPSNTKSKEMRIFDRSPEIREFYFLEEGKRSGAYSKFMQNVFQFKIEGRNRHDDSVDSLAMAAEMLVMSSATVSYMRRPY